MKNIVLLLVLLSIVGCVDQDSKTEDTVVVEAKVEETVEDPVETAITDLYNGFVHEDILTNKDPMAIKGMLR